MKKIVALFLLFTFALCGCNQSSINETTSSENIVADTLYNEFLSKKTNAVDKNGNTIKE